MGVSQPKTVQVAGGNIGFPGDAFYRDYEGVSKPGDPESEIIQYTVPVGKKLNLQQVIISCRMPVQVRILADSTVIGAGYTGAGVPKDFSTFVPGRPIAAGVSVSVRVQAKAGYPVASLFGFLQGNEETITP